MRKYVFIRDHKIVAWDQCQTDKKAEHRAKQIGTLLYSRWDTFKSGVSEDVKRVVDGSKSGTHKGLPF